jgi:hypothetical protein
MANVDGAGTPISAPDLTIGAQDPYEPNHIIWTLIEAGPTVLAAPTAAVSLLRDPEPPSNRSTTAIWSPPQPAPTPTK